MPTYKKPTGFFGRILRHPPRERAWVGVACLRLFLWQAWSQTDCPQMVHCPVLHPPTLYPPASWQPDAKPQPDAVPTSPGFPTFVVLACFNGYPFLGCCSKGWQFNEIEATCRSFSCRSSSLPFYSLQLQQQRERNRKSCKNQSCSLDCISNANSLNQPITQPCISTEDKWEMGNPNTKISTQLKPCISLNCTYLPKARKIHRNKNRVSTIQQNSEWKTSCRRRA